MKNRRVIAVLLLVVLAGLAWPNPVAASGQLQAGAAKVDITNRVAGPVNDPLFVKALVVKDDAMTVVLITLDASESESRQGAETL